MSANIDVLNPEKRKKILLVAANPSVSKQTSWPIGFWAAELTHPYFEFVEKGYEVEIISPDGGKLELDGFSDPRHESGYSAHDLISLGFLSSPSHSKLLENTKSISQKRLRITMHCFWLAGNHQCTHSLIILNFTNSFQIFMMPEKLWLSSVMPPCTS